MTDATVEFFHRLSSRGYEPLVREAVATLRFDLTHDGRTERWYLVINNGDLAVSTGDTDADDADPDHADPDEADADCVIVADRSLFNGVVSGQVNAMAALLRGELSVTGEPDLLVLCQRLFPGPPRARDRKPFVAARRSLS
jgi:putative sterol carrier protein